MKTQVFCFHFYPISSDEVATDILVELTPWSSANSPSYATIEAAISSYIETVPALGFEQLVMDVCSSFGVAKIIRPEHTFHI